MPRVRVGVAFLVPEPAATEVDGLRRALGDESLGRLPPHLTLVPPVNVRDLGAALELVRTAASRSGPFRVKLGPPATFWPDSPVVYLGVSGELDAVEAVRRELMHPPLSRPLSWPYVPHVTLLDEADPASIPSVLGALGRFELEVVFEQVHMLEEGEDRVWRTVAGEALGGPAVVARGGLPLEISISEQPDPDVAAWAKLEWARHDRAVHGEGWAPEERFAVVGRREGRVAGLAEVRVRGTRCELSRLIVGAAERDQGIGTQLLARVESAARESGCSSVSLRARAGSRAEEFFSHRGFTRTGRLPDWREGLDLVVMTRML